MKKYFLILFFIVMIGISACGKDSVIVAIEGSLAEKRIALVDSTTTGAYASIMTGYREEEYVINGIATELIEFCVVTFMIDGFEAYDYTKAQCVINIGIERYERDLELNPYDNSLVTDLGKIYNIDENVMARLLVNGKTYKFYFKPVSREWCVDSDSAIRIYADYFREDLQSFITSAKLQGEVYVKILSDRKLGAYYWHISFVSTSGDRLSAVIDVETGELVSNDIKIL